MIPVKTTTKHRKTLCQKDVDSQMQRKNQWLPVGRDGGGAILGRGVRGTNYYV